MGRAKALPILLSGSTGAADRLSASAAALPCGFGGVAELPSYT
jgi:hypothetical protein